MNYNLRQKRVNALAEEEQAEQAEEEEGEEEEEESLLIANAVNEADSG